MSILFICLQFIAVVGITFLTYHGGGYATAHQLLTQREQANEVAPSRVALLNVLSGSVMMALLLVIAFASGTPYFGIVRLLACIRLTDSLVIAIMSVRHKTFEPSLGHRRIDMGLHALLFTLTILMMF